VANVLIVDDDPDNCETMARFLTKTGHSVRCVPSGREALAALGAQVPDFILVDIRMPVMDGITLLEVIRSYLQWSNVPIAVMTAYPEDPRLHRLDEFRVGRLFRKSEFDFNDMLEWMSQSSDARTSSPSPPPRYLQH
jgi:CheY-like chemotaxis protein